MNTGNVVMGGAALTIGLLVIAFGWWVMTMSQDFSARAVEGTGIVTGVEYRPPERYASDTNEQARARRGSYIYTIRFTAEDGETYEYPSFTAPSEQDYEVGDEVWILYDPNEPSEMRVEGEEYPIAVFAFFAAVGGLFAVIGAFMLRGEWKRWRAAVARRRAA